MPLRCHMMPLRCHRSPKMPLNMKKLLKVKPELVFSMEVHCLILNSTFPSKSRLWLFKFKLNYCTVPPISHASKVMLKILQGCLQQYMNHELPVVKAGFRKGRGTEIKLPTCIGSSKKQKSSRKNSYFCFIDYAKAFDCVDHNKLWKILKEMGITEHLTCLLRNLCAGQ